MGRLMHDLALDEVEQENKSAARAYLEQARSYFVEGLKYARETRDILEELSNLAELAFIVDDFMAVAETIPEEYRSSQTEFKQTLDAHRKDKFRIYQFPVFENLYKLEKAATDYQRGDYAKALKGYREAYVGLASDPGYGRTRYKQHFAHLKSQIEKLPPDVAKVWCQTFIMAWEKTSVIGKDRTLAQEIRRPDLVVWCRQQLIKIEAQRA
jgi:tetratricopeptide (TPR) repeat protein